MVRSGVVALLLVAASAWGAEPPAWTGPNKVTVDLLRPSVGGARILVQATLPDGEPGVFLVDTGAVVSTLSDETAERLKLPIERGTGFVEGLSGRAELHKAVIPELRIGEAVIPEVEVAVGVPGVPKNMGAIPLDGILGNNVWSRFTVEIDYPADTLVLHRPGKFKMPRKSDPMFFDGAHVFVPLTLVTASEPAATDRVVIELDTGASGLMLFGAHGRGFEAHYTEGLEPIYGIGMKDYMPASQFLQVTRHIPVATVSLGGRTFRWEGDAQWVNFQDRSPIGPEGLRGLIGHDMLSKHRVLLDYDGGRVALTKSRRKARQLDGHAVLLGQDLARYGDDPSRCLIRGRFHAFLGNYDESVAAAQTCLASPDRVDAGDVAEARVLLAGVRRLKSDLAGARDALSPLTPGELVDEGQIVASVNGLLLDGQAEEALVLARAAVAERPEEAQAAVALSDALFATGRHEEADATLIEASRLSQNPDAWLLRRARIALAQGDQYGAIAQVRKLLKLYPFEGLYLWFYAELMEHEGTVDVETFRHDMGAAMARLHPTMRPIDYQVAAHHVLGDGEKALTLMRQGIDRDCVLAPNEASEHNCHAWYYALAGTEPAESLRLIEAALAAEGDRPDFLDTKAMVHLARGEVAEAHAAAMAAARLSPDDIYMLWQAERLEALLRK